MIQEDLDIFLEDFGVSCTAGAITALGIPNMPGEMVAGGRVISIEHSITAKSSDFGGLLYGDSITVDGQSYKVHDNLPIEDGAFCQIALELITAVTLITTLAGLTITTLSGTQLRTL